jgi:hypothetical protein
MTTRWRITHKNTNHIDKYNRTYIQMQIYMSIENNGGMIMTTKENSHFVHQSSLATLPAENFVLQSILVHTCKWFFICCKFLLHGPPALLPLQRRVCCGFLLPIKVRHLCQFEPANLGSNGNHRNHYTTKATVSSYTGFMLRRVLKLKFKGNKLVGWPRRRWFCQLLKDREAGKKF